MATGVDPVVPRMVEIPAGVILETLSEPEFAIYRFPTASIVMPLGEIPVVAKM
jgi:hypothetical protein